MLVRDDRPHGFWRFAKVNHLLTGNDGLVRGAVVRIKSGKNLITDLQRPFQLLYPLEVDSCVSQSEVTYQDTEENVVTTNTQESCNKGDNDVDNLPVRQPQRVAAHKTREKILT